MSRIRAAWSALWGRSAIKAERRPVPGPYVGFGGGFGYGAGGGLTAGLPSSRKDWAAEAGDAGLNSVVAACLGWLQDNFATARLQVLRAGPDSMGDSGDDEPIDHPLLDLLGPRGRPNPAYSRRAFWAAMVRSFKVDGNAYAILWRGAGGDGPPAAIWWEPPGNVTPCRDQGSPNLVDRYQLNRPTGVYTLDPTQILHLRDGIDPYNPMLGCARLKAAIRNVVGLNRAETYTAGVIGNGGVSKVWVPAADVFVDDEEAQGIKLRFERATAGENAGRIPVMHQPGTFEHVGEGPQELALETILDRPEATICAILGVSAMSIGLAVGNNTRTFTNLKESDRISWNNGLIPMQDAMAEEMGPQLLVQWPGDDGMTTLAWDRSRVEALQREMGERATDATALYAGGVATLNEARDLVGLPPREGGDDLGEPTPAQPPPVTDPNADPDADSDPLDPGESDDADA